ncbi:glyoxalase domain-containing protein 4-like [Oscarella lobularis]|uniref:glyoxalase domain-containing protein 4-like n=1 Tax=Oscarella lobularis TaxID=121494 RepID=UPI0033137FDB
MSRRMLHFVLRMGNRKSSMAFYRNILGMKVLRHEEFEEGCKASCNGPYDGKWSKTMVGYGKEDENFVFELTYNYGKKNYVAGDDLGHICIQSPILVPNAKKLKYRLQDDEDSGALFYVRDPEQYSFAFIDEKEPEGTEKIRYVMLLCSNVEESVDYWTKLLGMQVFVRGKKEALLGYDTSQCKLMLKKTKRGTPVFHGESFGRIAIGCPASELPEIESAIKAANYTILTPLTSLDTPGKATVQVVILADPDGHEICFVGDEAFKELSQVDPKAEEELDKAISEDKSDEWFAQDEGVRPKMVFAPNKQ